MNTEPTVLAGSARQPVKHEVCALHELPPGTNRIVTVTAFGRQLEIGVFNVGGVLVGYRNVCPHAGAPVCEGKVCGTTLPSPPGEYVLGREGEILRCPWHGWEFDLLTGQQLVDERCRLKQYTVTAQPGEKLEPFEVVSENQRVYVLI